MSVHPNERRRRPGLIGWLASHPRITAALAGLTLLVAAAGTLHLAANRGLNRRIAAIRAKGEPISIDDLNALNPVIPDDQNMTLRLIEFGGSLRPSQDADEQIENLWHQLSSREQAPTGEPLPAERLDAARRYLRERAAELDGIHEALKLDQGSLGTVWITPAISTMLPGLAPLRDVARAIAAEQQVATEDGDRGRSASILFEMLHLDDALKHDSGLICTLVRIAIRSLAQDRIERTINHRGLDTESIRKLEQCLQSKESDIDFRKAMIVERALFVDTTQWLRSAKGTVSMLGGSAADISSIWAYLPAVPALDTADGVKTLNALVDSLDKPDVRSLQRIQSIESSLLALPWYKVMSRALIPSCSRAAQFWVRHVASTRALQTALACERFRLATGNWPDSPEKLVPDFLSAVLTDPFDGKPIRFERIKSGIKVWSIGEDLTDDAGSVGRLEATKNRKTRDTGWILLNPDRRGRPGNTDEPP